MKFDIRVFALRIPVKIKIAFIMASPDRALPLKRDAAHIPVNAVAAQAEGDCQLFAAQQFAILHIGALQNIDPVMPAVGFDFCKFEARIAVEHSADHLAENLKEKRTDKRELRHGAQTLSVRLHTDPDGFLHQADGFFLRNVFDHLQIDCSAGRSSVRYAAFPFWKGPDICRTIRCRVLPRH